MRRLTRRETLGILAAGLTAPGFPGLASSHLSFKGPPFLAEAIAPMSEIMKREGVQAVFLTPA